MSIWKHGTYLDLWSLVHFLSGLTLCLTFFAFGLSFLGATLLSFALLAAWEFFEWAIGIIEPSLNVAVDLGVGMLGFLVGAYFHYVLGYPFHNVVFSASLLTTLGLSAWGFLDFYFRGYH